MVEQSHPAMFCMLGTDGETFSQWDSKTGILQNHRALFVCVFLCKSQFFRMPERFFSAGPHSQNATVASGACVHWSECLNRSVRRQKSTRQSLPYPAKMCPFL